MLFCRICDGAFLAPRNAVILLLLVFAGCTTVPTRPPVADPTEAWNVHARRMAGVVSWSLKGRMAVRTEVSGDSATLLWDRDGIDHKIELYGPFGGGRIRIVQDAKGAILRDAKKYTDKATTASELLYRRVGWPVPFEAMQYWVLGLPEAGKPFTKTLDEWGRLKTLSQAGWDVNYREYKEVAPYELPRKLFITAQPGTVHLVNEEGEDAGDNIQVKMVVKRWTLKP